MDGQEVGEAHPSKKAKGVNLTLLALHHFANGWQAGPYEMNIYYNTI